VITGTLLGLAGSFLTDLGRLQVADQVVQGLGTTADSQTGHQQIDRVTNSSSAPDAACPSPARREPVSPPLDDMQ
jgi:hypothetical protein